LERSIYFEILRAMERREPSRADWRREPRPHARPRDRGRLHRAELPSRIPRSPRAFRLCARARGGAADLVRSPDQGRHRGARHHARWIPRPESPRGDRAGELIMATVMVAAFNVAGFPEGGGHFWVYMQYVLGLRACGCDVYWLERFVDSG